LRQIKAGPAGPVAEALQLTTTKDLIMLRLALLMYSIVGATLAGIGVIAVLTMGRYDVPSIVTGAVIGALLAVPASWMIARALQSA
jgi:hypothetical protein